MGEGGGAQGLLRSTFGAPRTAAEFRSMSWGPFPVSCSGESETKTPSRAAIARGGVCVSSLDPGDESIITVVVHDHNDDHDDDSHHHLPHHRALPPAHAAVSSFPRRGDHRVAGVSGASVPSVSGAHQ